MNGLHFSKYIPKDSTKTPFEKLFDLFMELLTHTSGDVDEAIDWLRSIDEEHQLTTPDYTIDDFLEDLEKKGFLNNKNGTGSPSITDKTEQVIRKRALDQIFGKLKKGSRGNHGTKFYGNGDESTENRRNFEFGDSLESIAFTESIRNAQVNHGIGNFHLTENDLEIVENEYHSSMATVLMIDISHSMILYGEDRITPAKKVAMALSELIMRKYPKDTIDVVVFGNDAWQIPIKKLPYLQVGPYHTNTVAGLELAMDILRRRKNANKQIFMITDGKPTCIKEFGDYYMNSWGLDEKILNKTINLAQQCKKLKIPITTFMIARDPYLQQFVQDFTAANNGKAFYSNLNGLGNFVFQDFEQNRKRTTR